MLVDVVIPALNEEEALAHVLADLPYPILRTVVVADNGSTDATTAVARAAGATVVHEPERGYGAACLRALSHLDHMSRMGAQPPPDTVVFLDGDYSDYPEQLPRLLGAIEKGADLVIGSRVLGGASAGSLTPQQRMGNALAVFLLRKLTGVRYTDLGPFRAIRWPVLRALQMVDRNYGWTMEMQIKAAKQGFRHAEVPVSYRCRIGESKVSGTVRGTLGASVKILTVLGRYGLLA